MSKTRENDIITSKNRVGRWHSLSDETISCTIYLIRCVAILSVISAHVNVIDDSNFISDVITHIWAILARFGVPTFLITGGYYYHRTIGDSKIFWKKKFESLILPWIIASAVTYAVHILSGDEFQIIGYLKWFIGSYTFYYYMTIYIDYAYHLQIS